MIGVGTLTAGTTAEVATDGTVSQGSLRVGWRIRVGNEWVTPGGDAATRQSRPEAAPVVHTAHRIPGGDALQRVYAVGDGDATVVIIEVENDSPEAIGVGFVVEAPGTVAVDDYGIRVDGARVLAYARRPGAVEADNGLVFPVPHRTKVRIALTARAGVDVNTLPDADAATRAWDRILDRGLRTELPYPLQLDIDAARADLLLAPASGAAFVALEAWGFDAEAIAMWERLPMRARRGARRSAPTGVLGEVRAALALEQRNALQILPGFRTAWLGQSLAVHDMPLRRGVCSFAVRWHGARPALLWDVPPDTTVTAPALDPAWSTAEPVGETLLAEPPSGLLALGEPGARAGISLENPEQFS